MDAMKHLMENALEFLNVAVDEIQERPKFSIIHFHAGVELIFKARLLAEHWSLVVTKRKEPDISEFESGEFQSVSIVESIQKLKKVLRCEIKDEEEKAFKAIVNHRNKMVHFHHVGTRNEKQLQDIAKKQLLAWYYLNHYLTKYWTQVFKPWMSQIAEIDERLREHHGFLEIVFNSLQETIQKKGLSGSQFSICPACKFESLEHPKCIHSIAYQAKCLVCGYGERCISIECKECNSLVVFEGEGYATCSKCGRKYEPDELLEVLHSIHGDSIEVSSEGEYANCGICDGFHTVIRIDDDQYMCLNCFDVCNALDVCEWCNEPNTTDMENSYLNGCNQCEGLLKYRGVDL